MRREHLAVALAALIVVVGAYFLGRSQGPGIPAIAARTPSLVDDGAANAKASANDGAAKPPRATAPLPARDTPLQDSFAELQARADAGDVVAATRLYRDLSLCHRFRGMNWDNALLADELLDEQVGTMKAEQLENYRIQLDAVESRKQNMQRLHSLCDGADDKMLDSLLPNLKKAAELGEEHARACYLARGPDYDARGLMSHPEWLNDYRRDASSLIDSGMAAGDWKVVDILRNAYQPGSEGLITGVLRPDADQYYRYLKLYRLGAEPYRIAKLDQQLAAAAAQLAPERLAEGDAWADTTFRKNFNGTNSTESTVSGWDTCGFPYE